MKINEELVVKPVHLEEWASTQVLDQEFHIEKPPISSLGSGTREQVCSQQ